MLKSLIIRYWILFFGIIFLLLHLPFLMADPPDAVSWSRGPWTDEGIYLSQIRNAVNHENIDINESDCLAKAPLFNILIYPIFALFGAKLIVARIFILISTLLTFLFILYKTKNKLSWLLLILLFESQFYIFQYSHFAQAELLQCDFLLLSLFFFIKQSNSEMKFKKQVWNILLSCMFMAFAFYTKISSSYLILILPLCFFSEYLIGLISHSKQNILALKKFLFSIAFTILFVVLYILCWYLPFKDTFELFNENELSSVTGFAFSWKDFWNMLPYNYNILIKDVHLYFYILILFVSSLVVIIASFKRIKQITLGTTLSPVLFSLIWFLLEMHKMGYHYLPSRYLIFTILSLCSLCAFALGSLRNLPRVFNLILLFSFLIIILDNSRFYLDAYQNRHYAIKEMNDYLAQYDLKNQTIIGPWAPSATWECKARALPIWKDYYYHDDPINTFHPRIVISEVEETDSRPLS